MYYLLVLTLFSSTIVSKVDGVDFNCQWEVGYKAIDGFAMRLKVSLQSPTIWFHLLSTILIFLSRLAMEII